METASMGLKIGIIGHGFVGSAVAYANKHNTLVINDPAIPDSQPLTEFKDCDAVFVCVPSPEKDYGHCDTSILEEVLLNLSQIGLSDQTPIISKVTAPPRAYAALQQLYPSLVYSPEFLTAKNAINDYKYAKFLVIGGDHKISQRAFDIIQDSWTTLEPHKKTVFTDIKTAALYKYLANSYLAMKVTFMNDFYQLAEACDIPWDGVKHIGSLDERIGNTHWNVPGPDGQFGWGGMCFPKDIAAICEEAIDLKLDFELMQRVEAVNEKHRRLK